MANKDQPSGARPNGELLRSRPYVAGGTVFPGDFVTLASTGKITAAAASTALCGVALTYGASGDEVEVADHPAQEFCVQADETEIAAQTDLGLNYNITATSGDATYRCSRMELDSSTQATTATLPLKALRLDNRADNTFGNWADVVVQINNHQFKGGTGTAGV